MVQIGRACSLSVLLLTGVVWADPEPDYPQVLVFDPFTDGAVTAGADPHDVQWFNSDPSNILHTVVVDSFLDPVAPHHVSDFFLNTPPGIDKDNYTWFILPQAIELAVGNALEVTLRLRFANGNPRADASRTGVSLAYRDPSANNSPWSHSSNREYFFTTSYGNAGTLGSIRKSSAEQFLNTGQYLLSNAASINLSNDVGTIHFEVARIAEQQMRIRYRLNGGPVQEAIDTNATFWTFNRLLLRYRRATLAPLESMRMDDIQVRLIEADLSEREPVTWFVSPSGNDQAEGDSIDAAFQTITRAVQWARAGDTVLLRAGVYPETLIARYSGTAGKPIVFMPHINSEGVPDPVVISGFNSIEPGTDGVGYWQLHSGNIWKLALPATMVLPVGENLVRIDGIPMIPARWPNAATTVDFDRQRMATASGGGVDLETIGSQPPYTENGFYSAHYTDPDLLAFDTDLWTGAHIDLAAGHNWWHKTGVVIGNSADRIDFRFTFSDNWNSVIDTPKQMDRYTLWGHLAALDSPGEFFVDVNGINGPAGTLYAWLPDNGDPVGRELSILVRQQAILVETQSHLRFEDLSVEGGNISTGTASSHLDFSGIELDYAAINRNRLSIGNDSAVLLRGSHHRFTDGRSGSSDRRAIEVKGSHITVSNNVVYDAGSHLLSLDEAISSTIEYNTAFRSANTAVAIGAKSSVLRFNHLYDAGMRITDIAVMNTWNSGDMQGTEISYNWVHSNRAPRDHALSWWGGQGIRLDSGGSVLGCSNALIHHNVVWNTTSESSITAWGLEVGMLNYGNSKIAVLQNTVDNHLVLGGGGSVAGSVIQRNIAARFNNAVGSLEGAAMSDNLFSHHIVANNLHGSPGFISAQNRNYQLTPDSIARDHGMPFEGISEVSSAAYLGAYNPDSEPWRPGARLRTRDLRHLQAELVDDVFGKHQVRVFGLPLGRTFPDGFVLRVGDRDASEMNVRYFFDDHRAEALFTIDLSGLSHSALLQYSLDGSSFVVPSQQSLEIPQPQLIKVSSSSAPASGGSAHLLTVAGISGDPTVRIPVRFSGLSGRDLILEPVPWVVDTSDWTHIGMAADAANLKVFAFDGVTPLRVHIESGLGQSNTLIWLLRQDVATGEAAVASFEDRSVLYLSFGESGVVHEDDPALLYEGFPALGFASRLIHLRANDLASSHVGGDPIAIWSDHSPLAVDATQTIPLSRPVFLQNSMGGLPSVSFDGLDDHLDVNGASGLGIGAGRFFVVYRNPDPGTVKWQRLFSARANSSMLDYVDGYYAMPQSDGQGLPVATFTPAISDANQQNALASRENFRIGMRSLLSFEAFRGEIAEIIGFSGALVGADREGLLQYLRRKYGVIDRPEGEIDFGQANPGFRLLVDGVPASALRWTEEGTLQFVAPPYLGSSELPVTVDLTLELADGTFLNLAGGFTYRSESQQWQWSWFGESTLEMELEASLWGWNADPDGDGILNLVEYALGGNPLLPSDTIQPTLAVEGDHLQLSFFRSRHDVIYDVLAGNDLVGWQLVATNPGEIGQVVTVADLLPVGGSHPRRFLLLRVRFP